MGKRERQKKSRTPKKRRSFHFGTAAVLLAGAAVLYTLQRDPRDVSHLSSQEARVLSHAVQDGRRTLARRTLRSMQQLEFSGVDTTILELYTSQLEDVVASGELSGLHVPEVLLTETEARHTHLQEPVERSIAQSFHQVKSVIEYYGDFSDYLKDYNIGNMTIGKDRGQAGFVSGTQYSTLGVYHDTSAPIMSLLVNCEELYHASQQTMQIQQEMLRELMRTFPRFMLKSSKDKHWWNSHMSTGNYRNPFALLASPEFLHSDFPQLDELHQYGLRNQEAANFNQALHEGFAYAAVADIATHIGPAFEFVWSSESLNGAQHPHEAYSLGIPLCVNILRDARKGKTLRGNDTITRFVEKYELERRVQQ